MGFFMRRKRLRNSFNFISVFKMFHWLQFNRVTHRVTQNIFNSIVKIEIYFSSRKANQPNQFTNTFYLFIIAKIYKLMFFKFIE